MAPIVPGDIVSEADAGRWASPNGPGLLHEAAAITQVSGLALSLAIGQYRVLVPFPRTVRRSDEMRVNETDPHAVY